MTTYTHTFKYACVYVFYVYIERERDWEKMGERESTSDKAMGAQCYKR